MKHLSKENLKRLAQDIVFHRNIVRESLTSVIEAQLFLNEQSDIPTERKIKIKEGNMPLNSGTLVPFLEKKVDLFLSTDIQQGLKLNKHMNSYTDEAFNLDEVKDLLYKLVNISPKSFYTISVLEALTSNAKKLSTGDIALDAIMVQFINVLGIHWGIDYGLYTSDLR